jgi:hypothetical protein
VQYSAKTEPIYFIELALITRIRLVGQTNCLIKSLAVAVILFLRASQNFMMILMCFPSGRPHADPGTFLTPTSFLTGEQSDSGTDGQVDYKQTKDASSRCQMRHKS